MFQIDLFTPAVQDTSSCIHEKGTWEQRQMLHDQTRRLWYFLSLQNGDSPLLDIHGICLPSYPLPFRVLTSDIDMHFFSPHLRETFSVNRRNVVQCTIKETSTNEHTQYFSCCFWHQQTCFNNNWFKRINFVNIANPMLLGLVLWSTVALNCE